MILVFMLVIQISAVARMSYFPRPNITWMKRHCRLFNRTNIHSNIHKIFLTTEVFETGTISPPMSDSIKKLWKIQQYIWSFKARVGIKSEEDVKSDSREMKYERIVWSRSWQLVIAYWLFLKISFCNVANALLLKWLTWF